MSKKEKQRERVNRPVCIGDSVLRRPLTFGSKEEKAELIRGTVAYIHPSGRYHVVEFASGVRESFPGVALF